MEELIKKAEEKGCDSLFITILKERPLYPKEYVDHDIPEFGMKISPINGLHWLSDFDFGYILGRVYASEKSGRLKDWFECVFPMVDKNGNPTEYVVGLYENHVALKPLTITTIMSKCGVGERGVNDKATYKTQLEQEAYLQFLQTKSRKEASGRISFFQWHPVLKDLL